MNAEKLNSVLVFHYRRAIREIARVRRGKITLVIVRRRTRTDVSGTVEPAWVRHRGRDYQLLLSITHLWLLFVLCRSGAALTVAQIAARLDQSLHIEQGLAGTGPRTTRPNVRKQIERLRRSLRDLLSELRINVQAERIVQTISTSTREARYRVGAHVVFRDKSYPRIATKAASV